MDEVRIRCPFCWEMFTVLIAVEDGEDQRLILDCEICCHPLNVQATHDGRRWRARVDKGEGFD